MSGSFAKVIYWEKQGNDRLCALHCINSLLQRPQFSEFEFKKFGQALDKAESSLLKGQSAAFENADSTGYYSLGVIESAIQTVKVTGGSGGPASASSTGAVPELVRLTRATVSGAVGLYSAFLFNFKDHWFGVRKLYGKWWSLDSLKSGPVNVDLEISGMLQGAIQGGTVFGIQGVLPTANAAKKVFGPHQKYFKLEELGIAEDKVIQRIPSATNYESDLAAALKASCTSLPPEPTATIDTVVLMLRHSGGRATRRFELTQKLSDIFDWVSVISGSPSFLKTEGIKKLKFKRDPSGISCEGREGLTNNSTLKEVGFVIGQEAIQA